MKDYLSPGETVTVTAPTGGVVSGAGVLVGALFGVAAATAAEGAAVELQTKGVVMIDKVSAQAWTVGARIYWDDTAKKATTVAAANTKIGVATEVAANPSSYGAVKLDEAAPDLSGSLTQAAAVANLTENAGAIGGTNNGDLPDLTATAAALTENAGALGGTQDGNVATLAMSTPWNGTTIYPSAADEALIIDGIRECMAAINKLTADNVALRAAVRENAAKVNELLTSERAAAQLAT